MAKRFDETDSFINTVLTEANWNQANIKVKLTEETENNNDDEDTTELEDKDEERQSGRKKIVMTKDGRAMAAEETPKEDREDSSTQYGYDACPLCESELESDDAIFENVDTHFSNLINLVDQVEAIQESGDFDGQLMIESVVEDGCCPLCESAVEDDSIILSNMNEHFDVVLEMLEELQESD